MDISASGLRKGLRAQTFPCYGGAFLVVIEEMCGWFSSWFITEMVASPPQRGGKNGRFLPVLVSG